MKTELEKKLEQINRNKKVQSYEKTEEPIGTIKEFWETFIVPRLPGENQIDIYKEWFELLKKYCDDDDAVYAIRCFSNTCGGSKNYKTLRRGFYTKTNQAYSFFYTDNYFSAYFLKMAMDGYVPEYEEFKNCMLSRKFPARFGPHDSKYEKPKAAYAINGKDPGFAINGYKIAHIIDAGMNYDFRGKETGLAEICKTFFPRGDYNDWKEEVDSYGACYVRRLSDLNDEAREILKAHFLRFTCPFNYVLTPKKSCHICHKNGINDIAEHPAFQQYAREQFYKLFGEEYKKYLECLKIHGLSSMDDPGNFKIDIEYDTLMAGTSQDQFADFARFVVDFCDKKHATARSYKSSINNIMKQLDINSVDELDERVDDAIVLCTNEISNAKIQGNKKAKKNYSDYRSALKKYKSYLEFKNTGE